MKNQASKSKSLLLSLLLIVGLSFSLSAQEAAKKEISESYKVAKDFTLGIENKYGSIEIVNWDKNELEVVVEIIVNASTDEKAKKILETIDIDVNKGSSGVDFVTKFELKSMNGKTSVEVNYKVNAPATINANLTQKYGSIFLEEITGDANIIVKYGSLKAQSLVNAASKVNEVALGYSSASIKNAGSLKAKAAYSELKLGSVNNYEGSVSYSEFKMMNLTGKLEIDAAYSELSVENVEAGFKSLVISSAYGDVDVAMDEKAAYSYSVDTKYGSLDAPEGAEKVGGNDHGPNHHKAVKGSVGSSPSGKVEITAKYADVTLN